MSMESLLAKCVVAAKKANFFSAVKVMMTQVMDSTAIRIAVE